MEQRSKEWHEARRGKITSTGAKMLMAARGLGKTGISYAMELAAVDIQEIFDTDMPISFAMQHGIDTEPVARNAYEIEKMVEVQEIGFVTKGDWLGASPDGFVGSDGVIEIKCPQPATHIKYLLSDDCPPEYVDQVQFQMYVADKKWCDFVTFNDYFVEEYQMKIIRVLPDPKWIAKFEQRLEEFLELVKEYKSKFNIN